YGDLRPLHSFPTRRSSDLLRGIRVEPEEAESGGSERAAEHGELPGARHERDLQVFGDLGVAGGVREHPEGAARDHDGADREAVRSEEHTSELQSLAYLVCR